LGRRDHAEPERQAGLSLGPRARPCRAWPRARLEADPRYISGRDRTREWDARRSARAACRGRRKPPRQTRYARPADASVRGLSSTPKAGGFTAAAASADRAMHAGRVPRMPRWLRQPRHGSRAWYCPFTLASGSDPRHESRVALLEGDVVVRRVWCAGGRFFRQAAWSVGAAAAAPSEELHPLRDDL